MNPATLVSLNMRELDRLKVIQAIVEMGLKPGRAAERLGLTVRVGGFVNPTLHGGARSSKSINNERQPVPAAGKSRLRLVP